MSQTITIQSVLDDAVLRFGDPNKSRFNDTILLSHYNDACEDMSTRWQMLEVDASFDWTAGEDRISYPDGGAGVSFCVQMLRLSYNSTPSDPDTWIRVYDTTEDKYYGYVDRNRPEGDDKLYYWARTSFFVVAPVPLTTVAGGGRIGFWKQANKIASITPSTLMELPTGMRTRTRDRMLVSMTRSLGRLQEAAELQKVWEFEMDQVASRIEKPVDDTPAQFRPRGIDEDVNVT